MNSSEESNDSDSGCFKRGKRTTSDEKSSPKRDSRKKRSSDYDRRHRHENDSRRERLDKDDEKLRRHSFSSHNRTHSHSEHPRRRSKSRERHDNSNSRKRTRSNSRDRRKSDINERKKEVVDDRRREAATDQRKKEVPIDDRRKEVEVKKRSHSKERRRERDDSSSHHSKSSHSTYKDERDLKKPKHRDDHSRDKEMAAKNSHPDDAKRHKHREDHHHHKDEHLKSKGRDEKVDKHDLVKPKEKNRDDRIPENSQLEKVKQKDDHRSKDEKIPYQEDNKKHKHRDDHKKEQIETIRKDKEHRREEKPAMARKGSSEKHSSNSRNRSSEKRENKDHFDESYGPALPPPSNASKHNERKFVGPEIPSDFIKGKRIDRAIVGQALPKDHEMMDEEIDDYDNISSDDDDYMIGPLPTDGTLNLTEIELEREKRKIEMKIQKLDRRTKEIESQMNRREDWMLELPEVKKVPDLGLAPRQFRRNEQPDFSDRSSWTKTPNDANQKDRDRPEDHRRVSEKRRHDEAIAKRDAEQEELARKHKKLHKRDKSLLELHEKKLKKEKKKSKDEKEERRPFNRESDLQVNRFDESRKKSAVKSAAMLDDRFSRGQRKFL